MMTDSTESSMSLLWSQDTQSPSKQLGAHFHSIYTYSDYNDLEDLYGSKHLTSRRIRKNRLRRAGHSHGREQQSNIERTIIEGIAVFISYILLLLTLPISIFLSLKPVEQYERLVVFRLGRLQSTKGPGRVLVLPCIDSWRKIDLRTKAFNVPPIEAVTYDGGVLVLGATVYYRIKDALAAVVSIQDWNSSTRTLAHSLLHKHLNKMEVNTVMNDKKKLVDAVQEEMNFCTRAWGMEITNLELSEVRVVKEGENMALKALQSIMKPQVGGKILQTLQQHFTNISEDNNMGFEQALAKNLWTPITFTKDGVQVTGNKVFPVPGETEKKDLDSGMVDIKDTTPLIDAPSPDSEERSPEDCSVVLKKLATYISKILSEEVVSEIDHLYQIHCPGAGSVYLDLKNGKGAAGLGQMPAPNCPDCTLTLSLDDLCALLDGSLTPGSAYFSGRVTVEGSTNAALQLQILGRHMATYSNPWTNV